MTIIDIDTGRTLGAAESPRRRAERVVGGFLLGYRNDLTRRAYRRELKDWLAFLDDLGIADPIRDVRRGHVDAWLRSLEARQLSAKTVYRRLSTLATFYRYCLGEDEAEKDPTINVKRPVLPRESTRLFLTRRELADFITAAEAKGGYAYALACILVFNGLRVNEVCQADVEDLGREKHHYTLTIMGKGYQPALIALPPRTVAAIEKAHDGRATGPLILNRDGRRLSPESANRTVKRLCIDAGIAKHVTCHSLRHSAVTAYLESGVDITAAQHFARHADSRTTQVYDRRRRRLDAAGSYVVANFIAEVER